MVVVVVGLTLMTSVVDQCKASRVIMCESPDDYIHRCHQERSKAEQGDGRQSCGVLILGMIGGMAVHWGRLLLRLRWAQLGEMRGMVVGVARRW